MEVLPNRHSPQHVPQWKTTEVMKHAWKEKELYPEGVVWHKHG